MLVQTTSCEAAHGFNPRGKLPFKRYESNVVGVQSKEASNFSYDERKDVHILLEFMTVLEDKKKLQQKGMSKRNVLDRID